MSIEALAARYNMVDHMKTCSRNKDLRAVWCTTLIHIWWVKGLLTLKGEGGKSGFYDTL